MSLLHTIRVRKDWLEKAVKDEGGVKALADRLDCAPSTISRQLNEMTESGPRFIGAVLHSYAIDFFDAFDLTEEKARVRLARIKCAA